MAAKAPAPVIEVDRECASCGYNLRGLRLGVNCPECGMPSAPDRNIDDPLSLMPTRVIVAFIRGCWVASLCVGALVAVVVWWRFGVWNPSYAVIALAALALAWVGAAVWLTPAFALPQAALRGFVRTSRLRRAARGLQWGWVLAAGSLNATHWLTGSSTGAGSADTLAAAALWIGFIAGMAGIIALSVLLERLSEWARDEDAQRMFNWAAWSLPVCTPLLFVQGIPSAIAMLVIMAAWFAAACMFPFGLISLSKSVTLSILHALEHRDRATRQEERRQQYSEQVAQAVRKMDESRDHPRHS